VLSTVDDFRTKGAVGTLRDAVLDAGDIATDAGSWLVGGVTGFLAEDGGPVIRAQRLPNGGETVDVELESGRAVQGTVIAVDTRSEPPQAYVQIPGQGEPFLVPILPAESPSGTRENLPMVSGNPGADGGIGDGAAWLFNGIKEEWRSTVQDFKEKGAAGALKDAALDAGDMVFGAAGTAYNGVRTLATEVVSQVQPDEDDVEEVPVAPYMVQPSPAPVAPVRQQPQAAAATKPAQQPPKRPASPVITPVADPSVEEAKEEVQTTAPADVPGAMSGLSAPSGTPTAMKPGDTVAAGEEAQEASPAAASSRSSASDRPAPETPKSASGADAPVPTQSEQGRSDSKQSEESGRSPAASRPKFKAAPPPGSSGESGGRKSIVQMRREKFEKKPKEEEEMID